MQIKHYLLTFLTLWCFVGQNLHAQTDNQLPPSKAEQLDDLFLALYNTNQFNGSVLVIEEGKVIYHRGLGWANVAERDTFQTYTPIRIASVSKQFTSMAVMMLKEAGKIMYSDDVRMYLPELSFEGVAIKNLLEHSSGIPDYFAYDGDLSRRFNRTMTNQDLIDYFAKSKLLFKPGSQCQYSNTNYVYLATIVERISGMPFDQFLKKNIFAPLHMSAFVYNTSTHTTLDTLLTKVGTSTRWDTLKQGNKTEILQTTTQRFELKTRILKRAIGYEPNPANGQWNVLDYNVYDGMMGEKDVCISTEDFIKWDEALHNHRLVSDASFAEAVTPYGIPNGEDYSFGRGWKIYNDRPHISFHHGYYRGFRTYIQRNRGNCNTIVILSNRSIGRKIYDMYQTVEKILDGEPYEIPEPKPWEKTFLNVFEEKYKIQYEPLQFKKEVQLANEPR